MGVEWRFGDDEHSGTEWLSRPEVFHVYVDYRSEGGDRSTRWRRLMVATRSWVENQLTGFEKGSPRTAWVGLPAMVIVADARGEELRAIVDRMVQQGGIDLYSEVLP